MSALVAFLVAVNPPVIAASLPRSVSLRAIVLAAALAAALVIGTAGLSQPLLDLLDVSAPTFRVAAGVVVAVAGLYWVFVGGRPAEDLDPQGWAVVTRFVTPQVVAVAITFGVDDGAFTTGLAGAVALAAAVVASFGRGRGLVWWSWSARLVGLGGVAVGLALVVDGVKTV